MDLFPTPAAMMLGDLTGTLAAFVLFAGILVLPGWVVSDASDILDFRKAPPGRRLAVALAVSVCVAPILGYLLARFGSLGLAGTVFALLASAGGYRVVRGGLGGWRPSPWWAAAFLLWLVAATPMMMEWVTAEGMAPAALIADYTKHIAVTDAIARTGVPPANPALFPGEPLPLFYYYFWFIGAALVDLAGGGLIAARQAVYGGTLWMGLLAAALVSLWAARLPFKPGAGIALAVMLVTGLDLIPNLVLGIAFSHGIGPGVAPDLEWWNDQVPTWFFGWLWVPHHMAGFTAAMVGFLLLLDLRDRTGRSRVGGILVAGCAFASLAGLSVWVALVAAAVFAGWAALLAWREGWRSTLPWVAAGAISLVLALPFLVDLAAAKQISESGLRLTVREFWPVSKAWDWFGLDLDCGQGCMVALLPLNYGLELGFILFAAPYFWRWRRRAGDLAEEERFLVVSATVGILVATFVRADIHNNDLGWRAFLFVQFPMLFWAVPVVRALFVEGWSAGPILSRPVRLFLVSLLFVGVFGSAGNYLRQRSAGPDRERLAERLVFDWIATHLPRDAVVQYNPDIKIAETSPMHLERQVVVADHHFGWLYGIRKGFLHNSLDPVARLFERRLSPEETACLLNRFGIDVLIAAERDLIWQDRQSWVWTAPLLLETPSMRVVRAPR